MDKPGQTNSTSNCKKKKKTAAVNTESWNQQNHVKRFSPYPYEKIRKALSYSRQWKQPPYGRLESDWQLNLFPCSKKKKSQKSLKNKQKNPWYTK